jgi:hypothetical protein
MLHTARSWAPDRLALLRWTARVGAVTADSLGTLTEATASQARARLLAAQRAGQLTRHRPLVRAPALYTITRAGLRDCGLPALEPVRVSPASALHLSACASVAAALARAYPDHAVGGERELRHDERELGRELASARLRFGDPPLLHRPDLVLWPSARASVARGTHGERGRDCPSEGPVAVEVELTVKSPRRLCTICRAWARCRCVAGVLYVAAPEVERPLSRAIEAVGGADRIVVVALATVIAARSRVDPLCRSQRTVSGRA